MYIYILFLNKHLYLDLMFWPDGIILFYVNNDNVNNLTEIRAGNRTLQSSS